MASAMRTRVPVLLCTDGDQVIEVYQQDGVYRCTCLAGVVLEPGTHWFEVPCKHVAYVEEHSLDGFWRYTFDSPAYEVRADTPEALRDWLLMHLHVFDDLF